MGTTNLSKKKKNLDNSFSSDSDLSESNLFKKLTNKNLADTLKNSEILGKTLFANSLVKKKKFKKSNFLKKFENKDSIMSITTQLVQEVISKGLNTQITCDNGSNQIEFVNAFGIFNISLISKFLNSSIIEEETFKNLSFKELGYKKQFQEDNYISNIETYNSKITGCMFNENAMNFIFKKYLGAKYLIGKIDRDNKKFDYENLNSVSNDKFIIMLEKALEESNYSITHSHNHSIENMQYNNDNDSSFFNALNISKTNDSQTIYVRKKNNNLNETNNTINKESKNKENNFNKGFNKNSNKPINQNIINNNEIIKDEFNKTSDRKRVNNFHFDEKSEKSINSVDKSKKSKSKKKNKNKTKPLISIFIDLRHLIK